MAQANGGVIAGITNDELKHRIASSAYATCPTAAGTATKVATIQKMDSALGNQSFTLVEGMTIHVYFEQPNQATNPTLNVNGTGAISLYRYSGIKVGYGKDNSWDSGSIVSLTYIKMYDGNFCWMMNDHHGVTNVVTTEQNGLMTSSHLTALNNKIDTAGTGLSKSGTTLNHSNSITAGTIGSSTTTSGASIVIPYASYDAQGHITGKGTHTHTVNSLNTSAVTAGTFSTARLPLATTAAPGIVKPDGTSITINNGVISANSSSGGNANNKVDISATGSTYNSGINNNGDSISSLINNSDFSKTASITIGDQGVEYGGRSIGLVGSVSEGTSFTNLEIYPEVVQIVTSLDGGTNTSTYRLEPLTTNQIITIASASWGETSSEVLNYASGVSF